MAVLEAEFFLVEAGRRHTIHRGVRIDGADHIATERCNLDDAERKGRVSADALHGEERLCRWCFPKGWSDLRGAN